MYLDVFAACTWMYLAPCLDLSPFACVCVILSRCSSLLSCCFSLLLVSALLLSLSFPCLHRSLLSLSLFGCTAPRFISLLLPFLTLRRDEPQLSCSSVLMIPFLVSLALFVFFLRVLIPSFSTRTCCSCCSGTESAARQATAA